MKNKDTVYPITPEELLEGRNKARHLLQESLMPDKAKEKQSMPKPTANSLDKIREFIKYECGRGGWTPWISPKMKGYKMQCCDCGLVHEVEFKVVKFIGEPDENGLSETVPVTDKDIQILWRLRRV